MWTLLQELHQYEGLNQKCSKFETFTDQGPDFQKWE
jgi:hypothetical protein